MKGVPDCKSSFMLELGDCINNTMFAGVVKAGLAGSSKQAKQKSSMAKYKASMQALLGMCKGMSAGLSPRPPPGGGGGL